MGCFCHKTLDALTPLLPQLNVPASESRVLGKQGTALAALFGRPSGQRPAAPPAAPPAAATVRTMQLSLTAISTISALADFRASAQEQFGIDLLAAGQTTALARIVATLNARLSALASQQLDASAWVRLAALNGAIDHIPTVPTASRGAAAAVATAALPAVLQAESANMAGAAVLAAAAVRLNVNFSANVSAQLAAALRVLRAVSLPALTQPRLAANLTAALAALAQLRLSLGVDPLTTGFAMVAQVVSARLDAASRQARGAGPTLPAGFGTVQPSASHTALQATSQAMLQISVTMAQQISALATVNWQVPPITALPAVTVGLPVCALAAQLNAALGLQAVRSAPCGPTCDAARLARALN
jgi:hypothetical protein